MTNNITYLTQKYTIAKDGKGDCWRTALACILGKEKPEDIPFFVYHEDGSENPNWFLDAFYWFWDQGLELDTVDLEAVRAGKEMVPGYKEYLNFPYVASGRSHRNYPDEKPMFHAVVYQGETLLHDPHPSRDGLALPPQLAYILRPIPQD